MNKVLEKHIETLKGFLTPDNIKTDNCFMPFLSNYLYPRLMVFPTNLFQLSQILQLSYKNSLAVIPIGGGTQFDVGNDPIRADIILNLTKLDQVIDYEPNDLTITVQAGITFNKLQQILYINNQFLPIDPPKPDQATLGGTLATNTSGVFTWQRNYPRDFVIGMKVVESNGLITKSGGKVVKNVTGYDMPKIHIGSLGTLGIIAEVSLKLLPIVQEKTIVIDFAKFKDSVDAGILIFNSHITPMSLIIIDKTLQSFLNPDSPNIFRLAIRLGGIKESFPRQIDELRRISLQYKAIDFNTPSIKTIGNPIRDMNFGTKPPIFMSTVINLLQSDIESFISILANWHTKLLDNMGYIADIQNGKIYCYWYGEYEQQKTVLTNSDIFETLHDLRTNAKMLGGFLTITKAPPQIRNKIDAFEHSKTSLDFMNRLKFKFDPSNILNPGRYRYIGGI